MGFSVETSIPVLTVFLQGLLSFFSPCVLPLLPMYISYLSGGGRTVDEEGNVHYRRSKVLLNTAFFVVGISFAFFLLGLGFTAAGQFFRENRLLLGRIGGVLVILFGLYQLGILGSSKLLNRGSPAALPSGQGRHEPFGGAGAGLYLQLCLDPLRGTHPGQRPADGHLR